MFPETARPQLQPGPGPFAIVLKKFMKMKKLGLKDMQRIFADLGRDLGGGRSIVAGTLIVCLELVIFWVCSHLRP